MVAPLPNMVAPLPNMAAPLPNMAAPFPNMAALPSSLFSSRTDSLHDQDSPAVASGSREAGKLAAQLHRLSDLSAQRRQQQHWLAQVAN